EQVAEVGLGGGGGQQVVAADDLLDALVVVVDDDGEVVGDDAVAATEDDVVGDPGHIAVEAVAEADVGTAGAKAERVLFTGRRPAVRLGLAEVAAGARVEALRVLAVLG